MRCARSRARAARCRCRRSALSFALIAAALAAFARAALSSAALSDNAVDAVRMAGGRDLPGKTSSAGCSFGRGQVSTALAAPRSAGDCSSREMRAVSRRRIRQRRAHDPGAGGRLKQEADQRRDDEKR